MTGQPYTVVLRNGSDRQTIEQIVHAESPARALIYAVGAFPGVEILEVKNPENSR